MGSIRPYSNGGIPAPGDGPSVVRLLHHGNRHVGRWPVDCFQCGVDVAAELRRLGVGSVGPTLPNSPPPLQYRDVFVLTRNIDLHDDIIDAAGNVTSPASDVVRGLRSAGFPVCVLGEEDRRLDEARYNRGLPVMAVAGLDQLTVAYTEAVYGLERKVVVWLPGRIRGLDDGHSMQMVEAIDRLSTVSRCSTQLIVVRVPYNDDGHQGSDNNDDNDASANSNSGNNKAKSDISETSNTSKDEPTKKDNSDLKPPVELKKDNSFKSKKDHSSKSPEQSKNDNSSDGLLKKGRTPECPGARKAFCCKGQEGL